MSYIGSSAAPLPVAFSGVRTQSLSGTGSASLFTLNRAVNAVTDIEVVVNNVQQSPFDGSYSIVNNGLGLQFSENPSAGTNNIYVVYRDQPMGSLYDQGAVRKAGDVMSGGLSVTGLTVTNQNYPQVLLNSGAGGVRDWLLFTDAVAGGLGTGSFNIRDNTAGVSRLGIDSAGRLTIPNQPSFRAGRDLGNVSAGNVVVFNYASHNTGSHYNTSTGRFTAPVAGKYLFAANVFRAAADAQAYVRVNGSNFGYSLGYGSTYMMMTQVLVLSLNAGDYVDLYVPVGTVYAGGSWFDCTFTGQLLG